MTPRSLLLSAFLLASSADAFQSIALPTRTPTALAADSSTGSSTSDDGTYPPQFHRAVECAKNQGLCNVDELLTLANELEAYEDSCVWEIPMNGDTSVEDDDDCETEFLDRLDIADLLRAESEMMQRRENALEFSNLFREKIEQEEEEQAAKTAPKEVIDLYSQYYECMYSQTGCGP